MITERLKYACVIVVYIFLFVILIYGLVDIMNRYSHSNLNATQTISNNVQVRILLMN